MKRDVVISLAIVLYALIAGYTMLRPNIFAALAPQIAPQTLAAQTIRFEALPDSPDPNEVFALVNRERLSRGNPALVADEKLSRVARTRAQDMAKRQYYAHKSTDGTFYYDLFPAHDVKN